MRFLALGLGVFALSQSIAAEQGKLLATSGVHQIEGSGGGGLTPWATLSGYDTKGQFSVSTFSSLVNVDDFRLHTLGLATSFNDQFELSFTHQNFDLSSLSGEIQQNVFGFKYKLFGDIIYKAPQVSVGIQHKRLLDQGIAQLLNAAQTHQDTDYYIAASGLHLGAVAGYHFLWNLTARYTNANQIGLLGFGNTQGSDFRLMTEVSLGLVLRPDLVVGAEYRQKPDRLALQEDDWSDVFLAYFPSKSVSLTLGWVELGDIAGALAQDGFYFAVTAGLE